MNFYWKYILGIFFLGVLFLLDNLSKKDNTLKEMIKENYDLQNSNHILRGKIDDLKEDSKFLKERVMEFKGGELTKGELIKSVQALIDKEEIERLERLQKIIQE